MTTHEFLLGEAVRLKVLNVVDVPNESDRDRIIAFLSKLGGFLDTHESTRMVFAFGTERAAMRAADRLEHGSTLWQLGFQLRVVDSDLEVLW